MRAMPIVGTPSRLGISFQAAQKVETTATPVHRMAAVASFVHLMRGMATCAAQSPRSSRCFVGIEDDTHTNFFA